MRRLKIYFKPSLVIVSILLLTINISNASTILQGGDTIEDATPVEAIPFSSEGTTIGYTDDYDEVCPYSGSTSPDVVYVYAADEDIVVDMFMCRSEYDTKLYVYENSEDSLIACNDDFCPGYLSVLLGVELFAGNNYYIVIDGYGGDAGYYSIDIVDTLFEDYQCPEGTVYGQPSHDNDDYEHRVVSDIGSPGSCIVYDNFENAGIIGGVHFWGFDIEFNDYSECTENPMTFEIMFYEYEDNMPGDVITIYTVSLSPVSSRRFSCFFVLHEYETSFDPPLTLTDGWISIQGISEPEECMFEWISGRFGDEYSYQWNGSTMVEQDFDLAFCLLEGTVDISLDDNLPVEYELMNAYPNPFNASTVIRYSLPKASDVAIHIYDVLGRRVETLTNTIQPAGNHQVIWDAEHNPSGIYFYRIQADDYINTKKMVLLK